MKWIVCITVSLLSSLLNWLGLCVCVRSLLAIENQLMTFSTAVSYLIFF